MSASRDRRLYLAGELPALLQLSQEQIDRLVKTGQLRALRIAGEVRFDSNELDELIETYKQIERRKNPNVNFIQ
jgi:predicted DNA-binding transcriptional regulator AlpA